MGALSILCAAGGGGGGPGEGVLTMGGIGLGFFFFGGGSGARSRGRALSLGYIGIPVLFVVSYSGAGPGVSKLSCSTGIKGAIDGDLLLVVGSSGLRALMALFATLNLSSSGPRTGKSRCLGKSPDKTLVPTGAAPGPGPGPGGGPGPCPVSCDWSDL